MVAVTYYLAILIYLVFEVWLSSIGSSIYYPAFFVISFQFRNCLTCIGGFKYYYFFSIGSLFHKNLGLWLLSSIFYIFSVGGLLKTYWCSISCIGWFYVFCAGGLFVKFWGFWQLSSILISLVMGAHLISLLGSDYHLEFLVICFVLGACLSSIGGRNYYLEKFWFL